MNIRAVYCAGGVGVTCNKMDSSLDCNLLLCYIEEFDVLCGQFIYFIYDLQDSMADGCPAAEKAKVDSTCKKPPGMASECCSKM